MTTNDKDQRIRKFTLIITAYPIALIVVSIGVNLLVFGVTRPVLALPSMDILIALIASGLMLVFNHTWLMTATELTRLRHTMYATHEEWTANNARKEDVAEEGWIELERHHNAHRNATENTVYFAVLAFAVSIISPPTLMAQIWLIGFAIARIGYTYGALRRIAGLRQAAMTASLLAIYGLSSYLVLSLLA
jgi:uncharacterized MAPEG superfamily protein